MKRPVLSTLFGILLGGMFGVLLWQWAQSPSIIDRRRMLVADRYLREIRSRQETVGRELAAGVGLSRWAGSYFMGDGFSRTNLMLGPESGYVLTANGCLGTIELNYGALHADGAWLFPTFTPGGFSGTGSVLPRELIHVPFGDRDYLISPEQVIAFCNDVRAGFEPRSVPEGIYWMRDGDYVRSAHGQPLLPQQYEFARTAPAIRATVQQVLPNVSPNAELPEPRVVRVRLDLTRKTGAFKGMQLTFSDPRSPGAVTGWIAGVDNRGSFADLYLTEEHPRAEIGWSFTRPTPRD